MPIAKSLETIQNIIDKIPKNAWPKPFPKKLRVGISGWFEYVIFAPRNERVEAEWKYGEDLLGIIRNLRLIPLMNEQVFTDLFGKRYSARYRVMKHITGGSVDIRQIKVTQDMICKLEKTWNLVVFQYTSAASQKLGKQTKPYSVRVVVKVDQEASPKFL